MPDKGNLQIQLLNKMHHQASTAHPERNKMRKLLAERYYWPGITQNINQYVVNCHMCWQIQNPHNKPPELLQSLPIPDQL